jgi:hypothetical protein
LNSAAGGFGDCLVIACPEANGDSASVDYAIDTLFDMKPPEAELGHEEGDRSLDIERCQNCVVERNSVSVSTDAPCEA